MTKTKMILGVIGAMLLVGFFIIVNLNSGVSESDHHIELTGETKEIEVEVSNWKFVPELIEVNLGDEVELHLESIEGTHGIVVPQFGINEVLKLGEDVHVDFIADKKGTFNFYCGVPCGRGHSGMNGIIVVK